VAQKQRKQRETFGAIRRRDSGRYQASYIGPDGERHNAPHTFDTTTDARAWLTIQRAKMLQGDWQTVDAERARAGKSRETLGEYAQTWLTTRTNRHGETLRPRTRTEYERLLGTTLAPLTPLPLKSITSAKIRDWYAAQLVGGTKTQAARGYGLLKAVLSTAASDGRITVNPANIRGGHLASTGKKVEPPTGAELAVIADRVSPRYRAAVLLAAWSGARYGELTELRRRDLTVSEDRQVIVVDVTRAVTHTTGIGYVIGKTKSAAGVRSIVIPPHVTAEVLAHLETYVPDSPDALLFPARDGVTHLAQTTLAKSYYPARAAAGRSDMPWHALRHYGATRAAMAGATLKELQTRLGHSTVSAAMKYQHTAGRDLDLARRMSELAENVSAERKVN